MGFAKALQNTYQGETLYVYSAGLLQKLYSARGLNRPYSSPYRRKALPMSILWLWQTFLGCKYGMGFYSQDKADV